MWLEQMIDLRCFIIVNCEKCLKMIKFQAIIHLFENFFVFNIVNVTQIKLFLP